ncbi:Uncharacterised protein [Vibrio cholerae]|nr:Uncharacterised protein [Vibrio cholerae]CSI19646.1 Uncharacterised protein [Vibrio cholerae]
MAITAAQNGNLQSSAHWYASWKGQPQFCKYQRLRA